MSLFLPEISQSPVPEEDDDDLSITSTDPGGADSDKDWFVDDILAERPHSSIPGAKQYLIMWEDFDLLDCTWEPVENLGDGLLAQWEEKKAEIEAGARQPFDLSLYEAACLPRAQRHARRNAKRQRLGLPLTPPFPPGYTEEAPTASTDDQESSGSDDEAEEVTEVDPVVFVSARPKPKTVAGVDSGISTTVPATSPSVPATSSTATGSTSKSTFTPISAPAPAKAKTGTVTTQKVVKQKIFTGIPSPVLQKDTVPSRVPGNDQRPRPSPPLSNPSKTSGTGPSSKPAAPTRKTSGGTLTGYQGTARRSSLFAKSSSSKAPIQGKSTSTQKPSLTINTSIVSSSTSAGKPTAKRLTATRTRKLPVTAAVNVFAGGKQAKKRKNLGDIMADPSKAPKAFSNLRITNIARKRGIEKGDAVGSLASIPARFLLGDDQNIPLRRLSITTPTTVESPSANEKPSDGTSVPPTAAPKAQPPAEPTEPKNIEETRNVKRKKSVRFMGEADTDMPDVISNLFDDPVDAKVNPERPNDNDKTAAPRRSSLTTHQEQEWTQVIERPVKFGHSQPLMVKFTGLPQQADSWFAALQAQTGFDFKCTCTAFHFFSQRFQLVMQGLCRGAIEPVSDQHAAALENVAESLRRSSLALHLVAQEYSLIVYPAKCTQWDWIDTGFERNMDTASDGPLRHFIFRSADTLPPRAYPSAFFNDPEAFNQLIRPNGLNDPEIVGILTKLDFAKLQPQELKLNGKQVYMLLIPLKARQLIRVMKAWLRLHAPDRLIFTVEQSGSWRSFHEMVDAGAGGTIISHCQFTLWSLEKIQGVWRMLESQKYTFWTLDTGELNPPQYPSDLGATSIPGTLRLTRLFPFGRAFLITPSFAISEPAKLYNFLKWFKSYAANPGHIIVTCHRFSQFLREIVEEKEIEQRAVISEYRNSKNVDNLLDRIGRSEQDIDDHHRAWELLQGIIAQFGGEDTSEDVRKIHWLDEFIDPNDEQSLVNAFCWWSQMKLDKFRRFYVLGSDASKITRAYRYIDIPRYSDTDGSDPDIASILLQRNALAVERQKEADENGTEINIAWGTGGVVENFRPRVVGEWRHSVCEAPFPFPGSLFRTDTIYELQRWIDNHRARTLTNWSELHAKPVAWRDWNMAVQFNDGGENSSQFDTFSSWFSATPNFIPSRTTWFGLFYTITEEWDEYMPKRRYERHPWIAIYRPKNPHRLRSQPAFTQTELFIWDVSFDNRGRFGDCFLDMQLQLIDYVNVETRRKFPNCILADVWYSSTKDSPPGPSDNHLDITCLKIQELFENSRTLLPVEQNALANRWLSLDERLWKDGMSPMASMMKPLVKPSELTLRQIPQREDDLRKPERMVFHPVSRTNGARQTKCLNHLYETCLQARLRDPEADLIRYQYRPTREWWAEQMEEGRGYGYVHVDAGGTIINKLTRDD